MAGMAQGSDGVGAGVTMNATLAGECSVATANSEVDLMDALLLQEEIRKNCLVVRLGPGTRLSQKVMAMLSSELQPLISGLRTEVPAPVTVHMLWTGVLELHFNLLLGPRAFTGLVAPSQTISIARNATLSWDNIHIEAGWELLWQWARLLSPSPGPLLISNSQLVFRNCPRAELSRLTSFARQVSRTSIPAFPQRPGLPVAPLPALEEEQQEPLVDADNLTVVILAGYMPSAAESAKGEGGVWYYNTTLICQALQDAGLGPEGGSAQGPAGSGAAGGAQDPLGEPGSSQLGSSSGEQAAGAGAQPQQSGPLQQGGGSAAAPGQAQTAAGGALGGEPGGSGGGGLAAAAVVAIAVVVALLVVCTVAAVLLIRRRRRSRERQLELDGDVEALSPSKLRVPAAQDALEEHASLVPLAEADQEMAGGADGGGQLLLQQLRLQSMLDINTLLLQQSLSSPGGPILTGQMLWDLVGLPQQGQPCAHSRPATDSPKPGAERDATAPPRDLALSAPAAAAAGAAFASQTTASLPQVATRSTELLCTWLASGSGLSMGGSAEAPMQRAQSVQPQCAQASGSARPQLAACSWPPTRARHAGQAQRTARVGFCRSVANGSSIDAAQIFCSLLQLKKTVMQLSQPASSIVHRSNATSSSSRIGVPRRNPAGSGGSLRQGGWAVGSGSGADVGRVAAAAALPMPMPEVELAAATALASDASSPAPAAPVLLHGDDALPTKGLDLPRRWHYEVPDVLLVSCCGRIEQGAQTWNGSRDAPPHSWVPEDQSLGSRILGLQRTWQQQSGGSWQETNGPGSTDSTISKQDLTDGAWHRSALPQDLHFQFHFPSGSMLPPGLPVGLGSSGSQPRSRSRSSMRESHSSDASRAGSGDSTSASSSMRGRAPHVEDTGHAAAGSRFYTAKSWYRTLVQGRSGLSAGVRQEASKEAPEGEFNTSLVPSESSSKEEDLRHRLGCLRSPSLEKLVLRVMPQLPDVDLGVDPKNDITYVAFLGKGAFGKVYEGWWTGRDGVRRHVAVKLMAVKAMYTQKDHRAVLRSFERELDVMSRIKHPHIVRCYGGCITDQHACILLEFIAAGTLNRYIQDHRQQGLSGQEVLAVGHQVAAALSHLHPVIVHSDIKSDNILITSSGEAKVSDFGLSKMKYRTVVKSIMGGTPVYTAPEVFASEDVTEKCDIYSLAMVMWECLTAQRPWQHLGNQLIMQLYYKVKLEGKRPRIPANCDRDLAALIVRCWQDDPCLRPAAPEVARRTQLLLAASQAPWHPQASSTADSMGGSVSLPEAAGT